MTTKKTTPITIGNLYGCSTFGFVKSNSSSDFIEEFNVADELIELMKEHGTEIPLCDLDSDVMQVFEDNVDNLNEFTHCLVMPSVILDENMELTISDDNSTTYYLTWE